MSSRIYNFSAGPATLPLPVLEQAREELLSLPGIGMSVLEISHRSKTAEEIFETAESNIRKLYSIPDTHQVLFLHGGASLQFSMVPMNLLLGPGRKTDYILTGSWGKKAVAEAKKEGGVHLAWDGGDNQYRCVPRQDELDLDPASSYVHFTSNETIEGVEFQSEPECDDVPLVCDGSSNFLSRSLAIEKYGLLYAGVQKNAGPAGLAIVIIREDLLERVPEGLPSMLDYRVQVTNDSLYNTPNVFGVYIVSLVSNWLLSEIGGLEKMHQINKEKASKVYKIIDHSDGFYTGHAEKGSRSLMNITWRLPSGELEDKFVEEAATQGLDGLKGHRSVSGLRASLYNAMTLDGVEALCAFMKDFHDKHG